MITVFTGDVLNDSQAQEYSEKRNYRYFIMMPDRTTLDSMNSDCFAKYANDASVNSKINSKNNSKIAFNDKGQVDLIALRKIKSGEEILCRYGKVYWKKWLQFV